MEVFNAAYPWIILSIGLWDASMVLISGLVLAVSFTLIQDNPTRWNLWDRVWPSAFILLLSSATAAGVLAATRGMLSGL